jgi:hypothetical protein
MDTSTNIVRRDLMLSMGLLALIITLALFRIAWSGNWIKVLRVSLAFLTYGLTLLTLLRNFAQPAFERSRLPLERSRLPFWIFALAAAAAELCSGWLRPDWRMSDLLTLPLFAAFLIGGFHWSVLSMWRGLRERIMAGVETGQRRAA